MRLKKGHIQKISERILRNLKEKNLLKMRVSEEKVLEKINQIITDDMVAEVKLEEEARKLLDQNRDKIQSGMLDEHQALMMIKKQLAKEKKMVL